MALWGVTDYLLATIVDLLGITASGHTLRKTPEPVSRPQFRRPAQEMTLERLREVKAHYAKRKEGTLCQETEQTSE